jgi:uncharacterized protein
MLTLDDAKQWYSETDPVHGWDHVLRVYTMAERLALDEGADVEIVCAAALLHDVQAGVYTTENNEQRSGHHILAAEFARQVLSAEGWQAERIAAVEHCIRAHRFRDNSEPPATLEAQVFFDADKLDAIGAIGAARAVAYAALAGQPAYAPPSEKFLRSGEVEPGEPHSAYHEHVFKLSKIEARLFTRSAKRIAAERRLFLEAFFHQLADETRGIR